MTKLRFRNIGEKVLGAGGYSVDHEDIGSLHYTGIYEGNDIVALLVSEWSEDSIDRMFSMGDKIVSAVNSQDKLLNIIASAYQIAGSYGAPSNVLDVFSDPEAASDEQIEALLPYVPDNSVQDNLVAALEKIIEMNRQHAKDQYGDANKAETWSCIVVAREALAEVEPK